MRPNKVLIVVALSAALLTAGCSKSSTSSQSTTGTAQPTVSATPCPTSNTVTFAKTKFLLHAGLGFGAFRHWIYKPYQAQAFTTGSTTHKVVVIAKAGAAALFVKREVRLASEDVKANPTLCRVLYEPLTKVVSTIEDGVSRLKHGDTSGIAAAGDAVGAIESQAKSNGLPIVENENANISAG